MVGREEVRAPGGGAAGASRYRESKLPLRSDRDLLRLRRRAARPWLASPRSVSLALPLADASRLRASERRLNALLASCGCRTASFVFLAYFIWSGIAGGWSLSSLPRALAVALLLAMAAKIIALGGARALLFAELGRLRKALGRPSRSAAGETE